MVLFKIENAEEFFVHQSDIIMEGFRHLHSGNKVQFDVGVNEKNGKEKAINVKRIS